MLLVFLLFFLCFIFDRDFLAFNPTSEMTQEVFDFLSFLHISPVLEGVSILYFTEVLLYFGLVNKTVETLPPPQIGKCACLIGPAHAPVSVY